MVQSVSGVKFPVIEADRRLGDAPQLIADNRRILETLNWIPRHNDLEKICQTAWRWEQIYDKQFPSSPTPSIESN